MTDGITRRTTLTALAGGAAPLLQASSRGWSAQSAVAPFIRTHQALEKLREVGSDVRDAGAVGDARADDTLAIQEIADYFAKAGGEWYFPLGVFKTTAPILWNCAKPQLVRGRGKRGVYPGRFDQGKPNGLAVILPIHAGTAAIQFIGSRTGDGTIELRDMALATLEVGPCPTAAFAWDATNGFLRNFTFIDCSIHGFTSAFDLFKTGGDNTQMGLFKAHRCTINRNRWIARTLGATQWNGFSFRDNEAGQNGYLPNEGGIAVAAHNAMIAGNCLEGQRDPIKLIGSMRGLSVLDNYFEANVGTAAIHLQNIRGPFDIGANTFMDFDQTQLNHLILLSNCGHGRVLGPYWADGVHKMTLPVFGNSKAGDNVLNPRVDSKVHGLLRLDAFNNGNTYTCEPRCFSLDKQRVAAASREIAPWNGHPMPVGHHDTTASPAIGFNATIAGETGQWVASSWLFRREQETETPSDPYISLSVNSSNGLGSRDYVAYGFAEHWRAGEWCLLTAAIRLGCVMNSLAIRIYPFGIKPAARLTARYLNPVTYVIDSPSALVPYIDDYIARSVLTPPNAVGFQPGDIVMNGAATSGGQAYYVKLPGAQDNWAYA